MRPLDRSDTGSEGARIAATRNVSHFEPTGVPVVNPFEATASGGA